MNIFAVLGGIFAVYYVIGIIVVLIKAGPNETGASGYGCGVLMWALIWPIVLFIA